MGKVLSQQELQEMASRWVPPSRIPRSFRVHRDTTDFFRVEYDDILVLHGSPYLIRHNAKEQYSGLGDEIKFWVKHAIDLRTGEPKIIKLVFYEKFLSHIGDIEFERYRSPRKEARILELVAGHKGFMQGFTVRDERGNLIRVIDFIKGDVLPKALSDIKLGHEAYFHEVFPDVLSRYITAVRAIRFLHENGEKHGDIRRDHILIDQDTGKYRWIDFDYNYRHRENIYGFDLFGLGNILVFLVGMGDVLARDLAAQHPHASRSVEEADLNIVFQNRVVNLRKIYPYIPVTLNRVLLHFSKGSNIFYEHTSQLLSDLEEVLEAHFSCSGNPDKIGGHHDESREGLQQKHPHRSG
jgi:hypothetical protein